MRSEVKPVYDVICAAINKSEQWSFLTSIKYMLESTLYVDSIYHDASKVAQYIPNEEYRILDLGTGSGVFAIALSQSINKYSKLYAIDIDTFSDMKDTTDEQRLIWNKFSTMFNINFSHYDGLEIPFPDNYFDSIVTYAVIEHIEQDRLDATFREIRRVLKKNGQLFVFKTPRKFAYAEHLARLFKLGSHELLYGDAEIKRILTKHKFDVLECWKSDMVLEYPPKISNLFYPILKPLNFLLYYSPLQVFAHHNNFILRKRG